MNPDPPATPLIDGIFAAVGRREDDTAATLAHARQLVAKLNETVQQMQALAADIPDAPEPAAKRTGRRGKAVQGQLAAPTLAALNDLKAERAEERKQLERLQMDYLAVLDRVASLQATPPALPVSLDTLLATLDMVERQAQGISTACAMLRHMLAPAMAPPKAVPARKAAPAPAGQTAGIDESRQKLSQSIGKLQAIVDMLKA